MSESLADAIEKHAPAPPKAATLGRIAELLSRSGIPVEEVGKIKRVSLYQSGYKDKDGEWHSVDQTALQMVPTWADGPEWPVVQPARVARPQKRTAATRATGWSRCVVLPDIQIGYFRNAEGDLEAIHDEAALAVAMKMVASVRPDLIVLVGDNLDLPEMSKYRLSPAFQRTTQASIDRGALLCAELRTAAPSARIVWLAGNHEERLPNWLLDNAAAGHGLRRGGHPASWPVMSVPFLCGLDDWDVEYKPGYPTSHFWINERLKVIHGNRVKSNGSTAHVYLGQEKVSVLYGHIHRREWAERTRDDWDGPKTILAASPGSLCRTDGVVPSTKGGHDLDGRPLASTEDWQQGIAVVEYEEGDGRFNLELVPIRDGFALYRGKEFAP